jgi:hypothetical protein
MKVLAEIMDAHLCENLHEKVERFFFAGADIVDLGFGFDATPGDVSRAFSLVEDIDRPLAVDTQDPLLIRAALDRADLVLSLQEKNIPEIGDEVADAGTAAVIVPGSSTLSKNIVLAKRTGIKCIIADPLLQPMQCRQLKARRQFRARRDDSRQVQVQVGVTGGTGTACKSVCHGNDSGVYQPRDSNKGRT